MSNTKDVYYPKAGENYDQALQGMMEANLDKINLNGVLVQCLLGFNGTDYQILEAGNSKPLHQEVENWLTNKGLRKVA